MANPRLDELIPRIANQLWYDFSVEQIHHLAIEDGFTEEEVFLCYVAGKLLKARQAERAEEAQKLCPHWIGYREDWQGTEVCEGCGLPFPFWNPCDKVLS